jgi:antitoxin component YwqK of YwqJK toxin-antitoxin module
MVTLHRTVFSRLTAIGCLCLQLLLPGCEPTFRRNDQGRPVGTGKEIFRYPDGAVRVTAEFKRGKPIRTTWYDRGGKVIATTEWVDGKGTSYLLRDDGSVLAKGDAVNERFHGMVTFYNPDGTIDRQAQYVDGKEVK